MPLTARVREPAVTLSGSWRFRTDPEDDGIEDRWFDADADWADAREVSVPHSWQEHDTLRDYTGVAWYQRTFDFDGLGDDERAFITFGAVDYEATVWVNGERVGVHADGYLPFAVDATEAVRDGENTVTLRVFDPEDISEIPHGKQGKPWYTRVSGPWQRVDLVTVPDANVEDVRVTPDLSDDIATVDVTAANADGCGVSVSISHEGQVVATTSAALEDGTASISVEIPDANYWTPEDPALYDVAVSLVDGDETVDTYTDYFGMRSISREDGDLFLNGEPFTMRGALDQAFYPDTFYRPRDLETFEQEIRAAKDLGFNLLRKHIKPAHPEFIELADRLGILVWEEPANPSVYSERSKTEFKAQLRGLIDRDYNRPSVVAWSIYNEEWGIGHHDDEEPLWTDEEKQDYLEDLYYETLEWDDTRLVCDNSGWAHVATDVNDYHEYFVAPDRLDAWRDKLDHIVEHPEDNYGDVRTDTDVPIVVSEFGTWGFSPVSRVTDHYDGDPPWFEHSFLESMKRPSGVQDRFEESHLSETFDSLDALADAWQTREFESVEPIIADMREHEDVAGYVITEFSDIEWEFNGILNYFREEKSLYGDFARLNAPVMLHLDFDDHAAWSGEELTGDVVVANDTTETVETTVEWAAFGQQGTVEVEVDAHETVRFEGAITVEAPSVDALSEETVTASMQEPEWSASRSVYVAPESEVGRSQTSVYAEIDALESALSDSGYRTVDTPVAADVALVTDPDAYETDNLLVLPDVDGELVDAETLSYTSLPKDESWNLCACFVSQTLLPEVDVVPGWAFEDLYPYGYVSDVDAADDVSVGYTEGWLENNRAIALAREHGSIAGVCTLRVTDGYGEHPIATAVIDRLVELAADATAGKQVASRQE